MDVVGWKRWGVVGLAVWLGACSPDRRDTWHTGRLAVPPADTDGTTRPDPTDSDPDESDAPPTGHTGADDTGAATGTLPTGVTGDSGDSGDTGPGDTADTGVPVFDTADPTPGLQASCRISAENSLRATCDVDVFPPQAVEVGWVPSAGGTLRTARSEAVAIHHELTLLFMPPETLHDWVAVGVDTPLSSDAGTFTSGVLPQGVDVRLTVSGTSTAPTVLFQSPCHGLQAIIADTDGEILWYHLYREDLGGFMFAMSYTEDDTVLAMMTDSEVPPVHEIVEIDLYGNELMRLEQGVDYVNRAHHDLFRRQGLTWVLFNEIVNHDGADYRLDGFYVFDELGQQVGEWHLYDHFQPVGEPIGVGVDDYSHGNSLWVDEAGDAYLSMRHLSAIAKIRGDLAAPDFGDIVWRLSGDPDDPDFGSDFQLTASVGGNPTFLRQHNVHLLAPDHLAMFDNRDLWNENSRVLTVRLDEIGLTADIDGAWELPFHCDFQGGAWHTAAGNSLGTCAPYDRTYEFDGAQPLTPDLWSMEATCVGGLSTYIPRFIPLTLE